MTGKETQTGFEEKRGDDVSAVPHDAEEPEQDPKASPNNDRQDTETASKT